MKFVRQKTLLKKLLIVDGLPGCGKTMLSSILSSFPRVELLSYAFEAEFICRLLKFEKINYDAGSALIKMYFDQKLYQLMMGRETNFRYSDLSSVFKSSKAITYFRRIFEKGDLEIPDKIDTLNPILNITTHDLFAYSDPLFENYKNELLFIEIIRHPYYMVIQQTLNMQRLINNKRDIQLYFMYKNNEVPYFTKGWEQIFLSSNYVDKAIYSICKSIDKNKNEKKTAIKNNDNYLSIPFELFVTYPNNYLNKISKLLNIQIDKKVLKELKRQKVPRKKISDSINLDIYKRCGWEPPKEKYSEKQEIDLRRNFCLKMGASSNAIKLIDKYSKDYERKYLSNIL